MSTSSIESKVRRAQMLFADYGEKILSNSRLQALLADYRKAIRNTQLLMIDSGVAAACSSCAAEDHGSCCAKWVEDWYDEWLLCINSLMGVEINITAEAAKSCSFIGPHGCRLLARHSFCVNFLCPAVRRLLGTKQTEKLLAVCGAELFAGWLVERELRQQLFGKEAI